ncbi:MAG TPA: hypothetical protein VNB64_06535, partial [Solirubrobacteraceae bacterium]|nr:hypothetical protein [Solirubrobacteraceae bacterium]
MPTSRLLCGGFAAALTLVGSAPAAADDVAVRGIQVTQGVQLANNSIPLVADRTTAVRALVSTDGAGSASTVTGRAHVTIDGVRVTPQFGLAPVASLTASVASPSLDNETDSLVFVLPAPTGIAPRDAKFATENVQVRVEITGSNDTNSTNNSAEVTGLRVESKAAPVIFFKRINWLGDPSVNPDSVIAPGAGDAYLRAALPLNDSDPGALYRGGLGTHRFDLDLPPALFQPANGLLDAAAAGGPPEGDKLIVDLEVERYILAGSRLLDPVTLFLWGWVGDGTTNNHDGLGAVGAAQAAYSVDDPRNGPCSLTHEALHNIGREHNASTIPISPATGFDVTARLLNNPASNAVTGRLWPSTVTEILDGTTNNCTVGTWPGETNYRAFMDKLPDVPSRLFGNREPNPDTGIPLLPRRRCRTNLANLFGRVSGLSRTGRIARVSDLTIWRARWCAAGRGGRRAGSFLKAAAGRGSAAPALHARLTVRSGGRNRVVRVPIDAEVSVSRGPRRRHTHGV